MLRKTWLLMVGLALVMPGVSSAQTKKKEMASKGVINAFPDCTAVGGNLVANCGFETGDFMFWTQSGDLGSTFVTMVPHSGTYAARLGPVDYLGQLTQVLATTAGQTCQLSFWLRNNGRPSSFEVRFGPLQLSTIDTTTVPALHTIVETLPDFSYTQFTYSFLVVSSSGTTLNFAFNNVPSFMDLDDVVVVCM